MGWFNKNEEVPDIPPASTLPELPKKGQEKRELPDLPIFPSNSRNESFNQAMVKSAVGDEDSSEENEMVVEIPNNLHIKEEQGGALIPPRPSEKYFQEPSLTPSIQESRRRTMELDEAIENKIITKQVEPIFVRIDKFQSAQKNFDNIREKLGEIEIVLRKIKDVKSKEDEEISGWSTEIEKLKSRLSEIDSDIFEQI